MQRGLFLVMLAAGAGCGDGSVSGHDGAPDGHDGATGDVDASDRDATPGVPDAGLATGSLTVRVSLRGTPVAGATVAFHSGGGTLLDEQVTDAEGRATGQISDAGQVTTSLALGVPTLYTVTGVMPGEVVSIDPGYGPIGEAGTLDVSAKSGAANASGHYLAETCRTEHILSDVTVPSTLPLPARCLDASGRFDLLVRATGDGGTTIAYRHALDVMPDADTSTDLIVEAPWRKDLDPAAVSIAAAPTFANHAQAAARAVRGEHSFYLGAESAALAGGGAADLSVQVPGAFAERVVLSAVVGGGLATSVITRDLAAPGALAVAGDDFLVPPPSVTVGWSSGRLIASWDDAAPAADLQVVVVGYNLSDGEGPRHWFIVVPPGHDSVALPPMPAPLADLAPGPGDWHFTNVAAIESSFIEDYGQARTERPGVVLSVFRSFIADEQGYTVRYALRGVTR